jgi:hypothetical protein
MASSQEAAREQLHDFFQKQADTAADAAAHAPSDQAVTHSLSLDPQENEAVVQQEVDAFFQKQAESAGEAAALAPSDQEITHSIDPATVGGPLESGRKEGA